MLAPKSIPCVLVLALLAGSLFAELALGKQESMVPMRDGVLLAADVYLPAGQGPWPVVLARTPYGRFRIDELTSRGYVVVTQDWRGYGGSEGTKKPFESDGWGLLQDGYDTVEWIAQQAWCDGKVGTWGGSALGITQNLIAGAYPPHLVCQHILAGASDIYSQMFFQGGVLRKAMVEAWWAIWGTQEHLAELLSHPNYDERWMLMNSEARAPGMAYPAIHVGGWYDIFCQGTINSFTERQHNGAPASRGNQRLVMGPWWHGGFDKTSQGELNYPANCLYPDMWPDSYKLYDYWLKGIDTGYSSLPAVRYYVMGDVDDPGAAGNEWRTADDWPIPYTNLSLYLSSEGLCRGPGEEESASYVYDPSDPVPTVGGANLVLDAGPRDQRRVEARDDVLVFTGEPLEVPVEVTGRIWVQLYASSSCRDTDFMAKLTDVYPDGRSMLVCDGAIRARHRVSMERDDLLEPGEVYEFWIDLWSTSLVFNKGHRIRLSISSSNSPRFEPNPNTGHPFRADDETQIANNTIRMGSSNPSRIILPLAGPDSDGDGLYDYLDPFPEEPGGDATPDHIADLIRDLDLRIGSVVDPTLAGMLGGVILAARARLLLGDAVGAGHLAWIAGSALRYDPSNISLPEARAVSDSILSVAQAYADEQRFRQMLDCIQAARILAELRQGLEGDRAAAVIGRYLTDAQALTKSSGCGSGLRLAKWLGQEDVLDLARRIQIARIIGVPEKDVSTVEGMLGSAMAQFLQWREDNSESMIRGALHRLEGLGISVVEVSPTALAAMVSLTLLLGRRGCPPGLAEAPYRGS